MFNSFIIFIKESVVLFDLIFLVFIIYFSLQCFSKGFFLSLASFLKWVLALIITIILQGICSISILVGYYSKSSAFVLALLTILINYYMHDFWNMSEGLEQRHELQNFVKNTGIIAGLLILSAVHPGKYKLGH